MDSNPRPAPAADDRPLIVAVTGATGSVFGLTLLRRALAAGYRVELLLSRMAERVIAAETGRSADDWIAELSALGRLEVRDRDDLGAGIASGSCRTLGMAVVPCSMGTLGRIAAGVSTNLIERAADVCLKEQRRLILAARETPLSAIHLRNMLALAEAGAVILPPVPAFYTRPATVADLVDQTVDRIGDLLGLPGLTAADAPRWPSARPAPTGPAPAGTP
jgi:4-hydroxy-3-polyprenylbenzoate decarboxylase